MSGHNGVDAHGGYTDGAALIASNAAVLAANGYSFVAAYIDQNDTDETPGTSGFEQAANGPAGGSLTAAEAGTIEAAGLQIVSIFETNGEATSPYADPAGTSNSTTGEIIPYLGGTATYDGATVTQGYADGEEAIASAHAIGQPAGSAIYFALDFDPGVGNYFPGLQQAVDTYLTGVEQALAGSGYVVGVYGAAQTLQWATTLAASGGWTIDTWLSGSSGWAGYGPPGTEGAEILGPGGNTATHGWTMLQAIPGDPSDTNPGEQSQYAPGTTPAPGLPVDYDSSETGAFGQWPVTCYCRGTRILTEHGEVAIERLRPGDRVMAMAGALGAALGAALGEPLPRPVPVPVRWIGSRAIDIGRHPRPDWVQPIRIRRDAFGPGLPRRDLLLSPDHAVFVDGCLIPARLLRNDATILRQSWPGRVEYYHIELDRHALLLAEGLAAESYLDTGNRALFDNAPATWLHPDLAEDAAPARRAAESCAPFVTDPALVAPIWQRLAARARDLGHRHEHPATTDDAALRLRIDGRDHRPLAVQGGRHLFVLPPGASAARIVSRAARPSELSPWLDDRRRLGVAIDRIVVGDGAERRAVPIDHPWLQSGWWPREDASAGRRWTDGNAVLRLPPDAATLEIRVAATTRYAVPGAAPGGITGALAEVCPRAG